MTVHIRPSDGARETCNAKEGNCPFLKDATELIHFDTLEEADRVYHERMSGKTQRLTAADVKSRATYSPTQKKFAKETKAELPEKIEFVRSLAQWATCDENADVYLTVADELDTMVKATNWNDPNSVTKTLDLMMTKIDEYESKGDTYENTPYVSSKQGYQNPWFECSGQVGFLLDGKSELLVR